MKILRRIGFDLDGTLYELTPAVERFIQLEFAERLAKHTGESPKRCFELVRDALEHGEKVHTLLDERGLNTAEVLESLDSVDLRPFLKPDIEIIRQMERLSEFVRLDLIAVGPPSLVRPKLRALGLDGVFDLVIAGHEKSNGDAFAQWIRLSGEPPERLLYVGDQLEEDIHAPRSIKISAMQVSSSGGRGLGLRAFLGAAAAYLTSKQDLIELLMVPTSAHLEFGETLQAYG